MYDGWNQGRNSILRKEANLDTQKTPLYILPCLASPLVRTLTIPSRSRRKVNRKERKIETRRVSSYLTRP